jgi:hypothetical protein
MSTLATKKMLGAYFQAPRVSGYYSGMFTASPENFYNTESVEMDIMRSGDDVAIVVDNLDTGYRLNAADDFVNKEFTAPVFKEKIVLNSFDLLKRGFGDNPFAEVGFRAKLIQKAFSGVLTIENKIRRAIELQSSQVLQTGTVSLTDADGVARYAINYAPKAAHFPTAGVSWATATLAQKLADLVALCEAIHSNGGAPVDELTFGATAWENLIQTTGMSTRLDLQRANLGTITPMARRGDGGIYRGTLEIGNYKVDCFTTDGRYKHPQTGVITPFTAPGKIVARASGACVFKATFGAIPNIGKILGATRTILPEMPTRMASTSARMDLHTNVWLSEDGEQLFAGVGSRPLMIPSSIDTFGCLTTQL